MSSDAHAAPVRIDVHLTRGVCWGGGGGVQRLAGCLTFESRERRESCVIVSERRVVRGATLRWVASERPTWKEVFKPTDDTRQVHRSHSSLSGVPSGVDVWVWVTP